MIDFLMLAGPRLHRCNGRALTPKERGPAEGEREQVKTSQDPSGGENALEEILRHLRVARGPDARGEYVCWCRFHPDGQGKPPHEPNLHVSQRGYYCHACKAKGSLKDLARRLCAFRRK